MNIFNWILSRKNNSSTVITGHVLSKDEESKIKKLDMEKMLLMDSAERLDIFSKILGDEKALWFNSRFEKDLVLKNQKMGMLNWIQKTDIKEKYRKEIIQKISQLTKPLDKKEREQLLNDFADMSLGIKLTQDEERKITELCNKANEAKAIMNRGGSKADYEEAQATLDNYISELKEI